MTSKDFIAYFQKTYRNRTSSFLSGLMIMVADCVGLFCCIGLSFLIINLINPAAINFRSFIYYSFYFPLILVVFYAAGLYPGIMVSPSEEVKKLTLCSFFCFMGISISIFFLVRYPVNLSKQNDFTRDILVKDSSNIGVISAFVVATIISTIILPGVREIARHFFGKFNFWGVPAVIYVTDNSGDEVIERLSKFKYLGYKPAVIIDSKATECTMRNEIPVFPETKEILDVIKKLNIKVAIICDYRGQIRPIMSTFRYTMNVTKSQDFFASSMSVRDIGGILAASSTHFLTKPGNLFIKRLIDLFICIVTAILVIPVSILVAIIIKITSPGPVFYGHQRVGKNGKMIKCWKFRSMYKNSQEMLEQILATDPVRKAEWEAERKFIDDPRVTPFGKFLRKTSLDELPQLWNIFVGEMSFTGPRPVTKDELEKYGEDSEYVLSVTPGLSGMWQISGRSDTGYEERILLDTFYIQNWSVWLDIWIIIKTIWVVINGKGAY